MNKSRLLSVVLVVFALLTISINAEAKKKNIHVIMETTMGTVEFRLYDETPIHRDNFVKLVNEQFFDSLLFHRIIENFVVQGGDPDSKHAKAGQMLGEHDAGYTIPAEFRLKKGIYHKRGSLNAAREGDDVNPKQESSSSQFCFIWGQVMNDEQLDKVQQRLDKQTNGKVKLTKKMRETYKTIGGSPHLDGQYTVFGEVVKGMDVVDAMQRVKTDQNDRPIEDVRIIKAYIKK